MRLSPLAVPILLVALVTAASSDSQPASTYDNRIVPGARIGPVELGGTPTDVETALGRPAEIKRGDYIIYSYKFPACLTIWWTDRGLSPGAWKIVARCDRWQTANGARVGLPMRDAAAATGTPDYEKCDNKYCHICYPDGLCFESAGREKPVRAVIVTRPPRN
jgi:hypothetical protein